MPATVARLGWMLAYRVAPAKWGYERSSYNTLPRLDLHLPTKDRQNDEQCDLPTFLFQMPHEPTAGSPVNILASPGSIDKSPCSTNRRLVHMQERPAF